ncbi:protein phosphatase 2C domain-containing protein [Streptomyces jumonjinensis]|uniref:protein phosphatase 2C domain-containing protein n=1 Tax=Streptomyces jumonjinensis TaxID=1945 RepID=UPI0037BC40CC
MSQQPEDDWWNRLYDESADESAPDPGPDSAPDDTLDARFGSAVLATAPPSGGAEPPPGPAAPDTARIGGIPPAEPLRVRAPWEPPLPPPRPRQPVRVVEPPAGPPTAEPPVTPTPVSPAPRAPHPGHIGDGPPTYAAEPTALPAACAGELGQLVADTALDGARYGSGTLRAVSMRGDSARYRGQPRRDSLLTARFGSGSGALVLVAVAGGVRAAEGAQRAAADACHWVGAAVAQSHARLAEDIRADRRGELRSGLQRLAERGFGRLRAAAEPGAPPGEYPAGLRCLLLPADPECRLRIVFGLGPGGLFRLRDGHWQDLEPRRPEPPHAEPEPVQPPHPEPGPAEPPPLPLPADPFRFRACVARPGDTLLLCSAGLAEPLREEPALAAELAGRWADPDGPPGLAAFLADTQLRVKGYADDRTAAAVWEG